MPRPKPGPRTCSCEMPEYCDPTDTFYTPPCSACNWHHGPFDPCSANLDA